MEFSKEQIDGFKKKHGEVFKISVESGESCLLRKPNRKELSYASMAGKNDPLKFNEMILNACWLAGDEAIKSDDTLFLSASAKIADIIEVKQAELEKL
jgi:hypothetical protein